MQWPPMFSLWHSSWWLSFSLLVWYITGKEICQMRRLSIQGKVLEIMESNHVFIWCIAYHMICEVTCFKFLLWSVSYFRDYNSWVANMNNMKAAEAGQNNYEIKWNITFSFSLIWLCKFMSGLMIDLLCSKSVIWFYWGSGSRAKVKKSVSQLNQWLSA